MFKLRKILQAEEGAVLTMTAVILILGLVVLIGGMLFLMWVLANLWNIALPLLVIIIGAVLVKRFLLEGKKVIPE